MGLKLGVVSLDEINVLCYLSGPQSTVMGLGELAKPDWFELAGSLSQTLSVYTGTPGLCCSFYPRPRVLVRECSWEECFINYQT